MSVAASRSGDQIAPNRRAGRIPATSFAEREASLFEAARALFYESGYEGTSIESIARSARVSPKTIYARFGGKSGLFVAAMGARAETVMEVLREPVATDVDVRTALVEFAERLLALVASKEAAMMQRLVFSEAERFPEFGAAFYEAGPGRGIAALAEFLGRASAAQRLAIDDPMAAAEFFAGALTGAPIRVMLLLGRQFDIAEAHARAEFTVDAFLRAFGLR